VVAAIPSESVVIAASEKIGDLRNARIASRRSCPICSPFDVVCRKTFIRTFQRQRTGQLYTVYVRTYNGNMNVTLSIADETIRAARKRAEAMGTSVNQLVRDYLEQFAGKSDPQADAAEFERLSRLSQGNSRGWKFNREELHDRR